MFRGVYTCIPRRQRVFRGFLEGVEGVRGVLGVFRGVYTCTTDVHRCIYERVHKGSA